MRIVFICQPCEAQWPVYKLDYTPSPLLPQVRSWNNHRHVCLSRLVAVRLLRLLRIRRIHRRIWYTHQTSVLVFVSLYGVRSTSLYFVPTVRMAATAATAAAATAAERRQALLHPTNTVNPSSFSGRIKFEDLARSTQIYEMDDDCFGISNSDRMWTGQDGEKSRLSLECINERAFPTREGDHTWPPRSSIIAATNTLQ